MWSGCCVNASTGTGHSSLSADERRRWEKTFEGGEEDAFCRLFGPEKIPAHIDEFLDWFMVRKVMAGQDLLKASGTVTGKLVRWLAGHGYIDQDVAEDAAEHAREASRDLPMADRLATLLHEVADGAPEADVDALAEGDWVEDQLAISDVEPGRIWFEGGVGPIAVPRKASDLARPGTSTATNTLLTGLYPAPSAATNKVAARCLGGLSLRRRSSGIADGWRRCRWRSAPSASTRATSSRSATGWGTAHISPKGVIAVLRRSPQTAAPGVIGAAVGRVASAV
jgi:hypothetical protein